MTGGLLNIIAYGNQNIILNNHNTIFDKSILIITLRGSMFLY